MQGQARKFNPQSFIECLCYSVFAVTMLYLVSSGKYLSYVTPRIKPYLYFTAIVMAIWASAGLGGLFRPRHKVRCAHCFVLTIPVLLLLLPHSPLGTSNFSGNYAGGNIFAGQTEKNLFGLSQKQTPAADSGSATQPGIPLAQNSPEPAASPDIPLAQSSPETPPDIPPVQSGPESSPSDGGSLPAEDTAPADALDLVQPDPQNGIPDKEASAGLPGLDTANRRITVSDEDFGIWISEFYDNMAEYEGYTVTITGFVFKDPEILEEDEFVPARLMMYCCVADLTPVGLLCKYDKAAGLEKDSWVTVEGTLYIGQYEFDGASYDDPQINVTKITAAKPAEGYVYPF